MLLVQCMVEQEIQILSFDGQELKWTGASGPSRGPAGIATAQR